MAVPRRKTSKSKIRMRKRSHKRQNQQSSFSPSAEGFSIPHRVCPETGKYRGKQVLTIEADE